MSNSLLRLIFPLTGEGCPCSESVEQQPSINVPVKRLRPFTKELPNETKLCFIMTSGKTEEEIIFHQRRLLFQAGITAAAFGKKVTIIMPKPWNEVPFPPDDVSGVHRMPKWDKEIFSLFTFVYPKSQGELFEYVWALGGLEKGSVTIPDLVLVENVEQFFSSGSTFTKMAKAMKRFFSALKYLSNVIGDQKPFNVIVTAGRKELFPNLKSLYTTVDEIWETARVSEDDKFSLTFIGRKSPFRYKLIFSFDRQNKGLYFRSLLKESKYDDAPLSPIF